MSIFARGGSAACTESGIVYANCRIPSLQTPGNSYTMPDFAHLAPVTRTELGIVYVKTLPPQENGINARLPGYPWVSLCFSGEGRPARAR